MKEDEGQRGGKRKEEGEDQEGKRKVRRRTETEDGIWKEYKKSDNKERLWMKNQARNKGKNKQMTPRKYHEKISEL